MMTKTGKQERPLTGNIQRSLQSFFIRMFISTTLFLGIFNSVSSETGCLNYEMQSLLAFTSSLHDPLGRLASWNASLSCCQWEGVSCDIQTGHVVAVDLHNCNLSGSFRPEELFELRDLESLNVSSNNFTEQHIPQELGLLKKLTYLNLSSAGFAGTIPWQLGNLSSLTVLDLSSSQTFMLASHDLSWVKNLTALQLLSLDRADLAATSSSWGESVSCLSELKNLTMSNCGLTGSVPPSLQKLSLHILHLDGNTFDPEFPSWIGNMTSLGSLNMANANLSGSLPFERLSRLPYLKNICLQNNKISGDVSQIFQGKWKKLTIFNIANNSLYGVIPSSIENLSSLAQLVLNSNNLRGTIPESLGHLRSLTYLDLSYNRLTGPIPLSLGSLSKLTYITLTYNALSGPISESHFHDLNNLKYLDLSNNNLTFNITSIWTPPFDLNMLILAVCKIERTFPVFLKTQRSLTKLDLTNNTIKGEVPSWLWNLPKLESLVLKYNQLEGPLPIDQLYNSSTSLKQVELRGNQFNGRLPDLPSSSAGFPQELDLSSNNITGPVPSEMCTMLKSSSFLFLASNKLDGKIPPCICEQTEYLQALDLSGNNLSGQLPSQLGNCSSLNVLNLANNGFQGQIPVELGKLDKLQVLHINRNILTGNIPTSLQNCKNLEILDLSRNNLSGKVPKWIGDLRNLRILVLRSNNLEGEIPIQIGYLHRLQILDLAMNHLSGSIPRQLSNLLIMTNEDFTRSRPDSTDLKYGPYHTDAVDLMDKGHESEYSFTDLRTDTVMDLSGNSLTGHVPEEIGYLKGLRALNVSHNHLTGQIPQQFGNMVDLEELDMSCNQLEGKIPITLADLNSLGWLNLSNNTLSGRIPNGRHFDTFEATSFSGNPELCGPPLPRNCSEQNRDRDGDGSEQTVHWWESWESWEAALGFGWAIGFGIVIGALALSRRLGRKYFQLADSFMASFE